MLKIGILGSGAIGGYIGGCLQLAHPTRVRVLFYARPTSQFQQVKQKGMHVASLQEISFKELPASQINVTSELIDLLECDYVLLCVKSQDTATAAQDLVEIIKNEGQNAKPLVLVSFQNGISNIRILKEKFRDLPQVTLIAGLVVFNVVWELQECSFRQMTAGFLGMEQTASRKEERLAELLRGTVLDVQVMPKMFEKQCGKLLMNLMNAIEALSGKPVYEVMQDGLYRQIWAAAIREGITVFKMNNIRPRSILRVPVPMEWVVRIVSAPSFIFGTLQKLQKVDRKTRSSMAQDLQNGKSSTEIDFLNGEIVTLAEKVGTTAPINQKIVQLIKQAERTPQFQGYSSQELASKLDFHPPPPSYSFLVFGMICLGGLLLSSLWFWMR